MGRFKFKLDPVKRHRERMEEKRRTELGKAQSALMREKAKFEELMEQNAKRGDEARDKAQKGVTAAELALYETFREGQEIRARDQQDEIEQQAHFFVEAFKIWMSAKKDLKSIEKIEEKKIAQFKKGEGKKIARSLDDLIVMRQKWKMKE